MSKFDILSALFVVLGCVLLSALFSGSETALTGASLAHMHSLEREGDRRAVVVSQLLRRRSRMIATLLLGNTLFNIAGSAVMTSMLVLLVGDNGAVYATFIMTALLLDIRRGAAEDVGDQPSRPRFIGGGGRRALLRRGLWSPARGH